MSFEKMIGCKQEIRQKQLDVSLTLFAARWCALNGARHGSRF
jgi:hypothetical protein